MMGCGLWAGERLRGAKLLGVVVAVLGLIGLLLPGLAAPPPHAALLMLAAGAAWGVYSLLGRGAGDPIAATGGNFLRAVPFAALLALAVERYWRPRIGRPHGRALCRRIGRADVGPGLRAVVRRPAGLRATSAATIQLSVPAIAAIGGAVLLAEPITARLLLASVAILGGIALTIHRKK